MEKNRIPPQIICTLLRVVHDRLELNGRPGNQSMTCTACKTVVDVIKFDLDFLKYTSDKIKDMIEALCKIASAVKSSKRNGEKSLILVKMICLAKVRFIQFLQKWVNFVRDSSTRGLQNCFPNSLIKL